MGAHYKLVVSSLPRLTITGLFSYAGKLISGNKIPGKLGSDGVLEPQLVLVYILYRCREKKVKMAHYKLEMRPR